MAKKKTVNIKNMREIAEAAKSRGLDNKQSAEKGEKGAKEKGKRKATSRRSKEKALQRKRLVWGVYSSSMKEEARFPYDQRAEAEKKVKQLAAKTAKTYFIQPIKELIVEAPAAGDKDKSKDKEKQKAKE
jgi:hypothetical protein